MEEQDSTNLDWSGEFNLEDFLPVSPGETPRHINPNSALQIDSFSNNEESMAMMSAPAKYNDQGDSSSGTTSVPWSSMSKEVSIRPVSPPKSSLRGDSPSPLALHNCFLTPGPSGR